MPALPEWQELPLLPNGGAEAWGNLGAGGGL